MKYGDTVYMKAGKVSPWLEYDKNDGVFGNLCADGVREIVHVPEKAKAIRLHTVAKKGPNTIAVTSDGYSDYQADGMRSFTDDNLRGFFSELSNDSANCPTCGGEIEVTRVALVEVEWR